MRSKEAMRFDDRILAAFKDECPDAPVAFDGLLMVFSLALKIASEEMQKFCHSCKRGVCYCHCPRTSEQFLLELADSIDKSGEEE
jgi:hypothetical protein